MELAPDPVPPEFARPPVVLPPEEFAPPSGEFPPLAESSPPVPEASKGSIPKYPQFVVRPVTESTKPSRSTARRTEERARTRLLRARTWDG